MVHRLHSAAPLRAAILALALSLAAGDGDAVTLNWNNVAGGSAATASNWSPVQAPTAADALVFNLAGTYPITFGSGAGSALSHTWRRGTIAATFSPFHTLSGGLAMGTASGDAVSVTMTGTLSVAASVAIGSAAGAGGGLTVTGFNSLFQVTNSGADLRVGGSGTGALSVAGGSIARVADDLVVGDVAGATGTVTVAGTSGGLPATLRTENAGGDFFVGLSGTGVLQVVAGGSARSADDAYLGYQANSSGTLVVGNGTGESRFETVSDLKVGANDATTSAGTGAVTVNPGGTLVCGDTLRLGDTNGGPVARLDLDGGDVHTESMIVDSLRGLVDWNGGELVVDAGVLTLKSGLTVKSATAGGAARLALVRGAVGSARSVSLYGPAGVASRLEVDSGASLTLSSFLGAFGETIDIVVDSSSTLTVNDRLYLGGASNDATLRVGVGSTVTVQSMECTDGPGATSALTVSGAAARLRVQGNLVIGGDETFVGGPSLAVVENGGSIEPASSGMGIRVRAPGTLEVRPGGSVTSPTTMTVEGVARFLGGVLGTQGFLDLVGSGRFETAGSLAARIRSADATTRIVALGDVSLGIAATDGFAFAGTLDVGTRAVRLVDSNGVSLGDSTTLAGGSLRVDGGATLPAGRFLLGTGRVDAPTVTNSGTIEVADALQTGTLTCTGNLVLGGTSTVRVKIRGAAADQHDTVVANDQLTCAGTLRIVFPPGGALAPGTMVPLLTGVPRVGTFSGIVFEGVANPAAFTLVYTATQVLLSVSSGVVAAPGPDATPSMLAFAGRGVGAGAHFELALPVASAVRVELYDVAGRRVRTLLDGDLPAGWHRVDPAGPAGAGRLARGVYFARATVRIPDAPPRRLSDRIVLD